MKNKSPTQSMVENKTNHYMQGIIFEEYITYFGDIPYKDFEKKLMEKVNLKDIESGIVKTIMNLLQFIYMEVN